MRYLLDADYFVYYANFPLSVRGLVTPNDDGTYSVILNDRMTDARKLVTYAHEVKHIQHDDFYDDKSIEDVESI